MVRVLRMHGSCNIVCGKGEEMQDAHVIVNQLQIKQSNSCAKKYCNVMMGERLNDVIKRKMKMMLEGQLSS